ncbi:PspA-associated protein PspAB [Streptomyces xinghaiensis]|uniref:PspA-associated protein PspAB n=1 Tax=Streptomyces xinghaiensis TaxID=1038928 RepID=UPI00343C1E37
MRRSRDATGKARSRDRSRGRDRDRGTPGFWNALLGRSKPVRPDLDQLFGLPSAAITLQAAAGFTPTGAGSVCFATIEGGAFTEVRQDVRALLDADSERGGVPVELIRDDFGYSWLLSRRAPDELPALVNDLHAVNTALQDSGFGPQLLCSLVTFRNTEQRPLALVYLYKRGTFYPFAPLPGEKRDNPLELQVKAAIKDDLRLEEDLSRWFPLWGAPGL